MRRSSCAVLAIAGLLITVTSIFYLHSVTAPAQPMTTGEAAKWLDEARKSFEAGNMATVLNLFTPEARFQGRTRGQLGDILDRTMREITSPLRVSTRNVDAKQLGRKATVTFTIDVGQKTDKLEAVYFPRMNMRIMLIPVRESRWLGLGTAEVWKIEQIVIDPPLDLPPL